MIVCKICYDERKKGDFIETTKECSCTNKPCKECMLQRIKTQITKNPEIIRCMCKAELSLEDVKRFDVTQATLIEQRRSSSFIEKMPGFTWCAHACGSGHIIEEAEGKKREELKGQLFICKHEACKKITCLHHGIKHHTGLSCDEYTKAAEMDDNSRSMLYIEQNYKKCPKCGEGIDKNGGCEHMTHEKESGGCGHEFCWLCMADFDPIRDYGNHLHKLTCRHFFPVECPKCGEEIIKSGGSDEMTCAKEDGGCDHEFCWLCLADLAPIREHGNHLHKENCRHYFRNEEESNEKNDSDSDSDEEDPENRPEIISEDSDDDDDYPQE